LRLTPENSSVDVAMSFAALLKVAAAYAFSRHCLDRIAIKIATNQHAVGFGPLSFSGYLYGVKI